MLGKDPLQHTSMYERNLDDSEDSDGEGGLGNLNRMVMRPAGHSGKAKKGHLCFDASFETGNLGRVDLISEFEYDLFIRPDTCCPKLRIWFNFSVDNVKQDQRVIFNIVNFGKSKILFNTEMTPIVKSSSRPKWSGKKTNSWQRVMRSNVYYHRSIYHRFRHILSFTFAFDKEEDVYQFAMSTPYSYSRLQAYLDMWVRKAKHLKNAVERDVIGKSIQKRKIDLITIGDEGSKVEDDPDVKTKKEKRHVIIIIARTHGGEPPSSFVCQGLMDFLISNHSMAQLLRQNVTFKIIPMLNPDGVHLGNQRASLMGLDLNRSWNIISQWAHPTLKAAYDVIKEIDKKKGYQIDFVIDIHAHTSQKGCFIYGNAYDDVYRYERHIVFPKIFASKAEGYCTENSLFNADSSKIGTARRFFCTTLGKNTNSFTLQVSIGGYHLPNTPHYIHYNDEAYLRLGRNVGRSLFEYYKQVGIITVPVKSSDGRRGRKSKRNKMNKLKYRRPKPSPSPTQQCLEPRLFSPPIMRPEINELNACVNISQNPLYEYPAIPMRVYPKKAAPYQKHIYTEDELPAIKYNFLSRNSPPPSLSIIDLNNTIRNGLIDSVSNGKLRNNLSQVDERSFKKKKILRDQMNLKSDLYSSEDEI